MSSGVSRYGDREITRGVVEALRPALSADASAITRLAARDVAQLLGLTGLEAALAVCESHVGQPRPRDIEHLADRITRVADAAESAGSLAAFISADPELQSMASHLEQVVWDAPSTASPAATYAVLDQLGGLSFDPTEGLANARVAAPVAAALRAALDWLGVDDRVRTRVSVQDSALELSVRVPFEAGLAPAGAVLASVDGSLGATDDERWALRLPLATARPSFLLVRQGHVGLALPWHAVARLRMLRETERAQLAEPMLPPLSPFGEAGGERPAALIALGLRRAWFMADRIVWRIVAEAEDADIASPVAGLTQMITVDDEHRYWVVDPAMLLRGVESIRVPAPAPRPRASLLLGEEHVQRIDAAPSAPSMAVAERSAPAPVSVQAPPMVTPVEDPFAVLDDLLPSIGSEVPEALPTKRPASFTPTIEILHPEELLGPCESTVPHSVTAVTAVIAAPARLGVADVAPLEPILPRPRRALVVDDSLVARIFLTRMLEQRGFPVVTAENSAELWAELGSQSFGVVFVDVCLPDARGRAHLERVLDVRASSREPFAVVVLTRDHDDELVAEGAGARLMLRKPFESVALDQLLMKLPLQSEDLH